LIGALLVAVARWCATAVAAATIATTLAATLALWISLAAALLTAALTTMMSVMSRSWSLPAALANSRLPAAALCAAL